VSARYYLGLDLGQAQDFTALAVARRLPHAIEGKRPLHRYELAGLKRWSLGTPYPIIVADVKGILAREPLKSPDTFLALDFTGCGRPIWEMFGEAGVRATGIAITGGNAVMRAAPLEWHVPKRDLASCVQVLLQERRLQWPASLPEAPVLAAELANFRVKITLAANDTYGAWREGEHDDTVLAVALACWSGENIRNPYTLTSISVARN
jgi:hypothetical protein